MLHETIRNDDLLAQHSVATLLRHCFENHISSEKTNRNNFFGEFCRHSIKRLAQLVKFQSTSILAIRSDRRQEKVLMPIISPSMAKLDHRFRNSIEAKIGLIF